MPSPPEQLTLTPHDTHEAVLRDEGDIPFRRITDAERQRLYDIEMRGGRARLGPDAYVERETPGP